MRISSPDFLERPGSPPQVRRCDPLPQSHSTVTGSAPATSTSKHPTSGRRYKPESLIQRCTLFARNRNGHPRQFFSRRDRIDTGKVQHDAALVEPVMSKLYLARRFTLATRDGSSAPDASCSSHNRRRSANFSGKSVRISANTSPLRPCVRLIRATHTHPSSAITGARSDVWPKGVCTSYSSSSSSRMSSV